MGVMLEYYRRPELQWWGDELPQLRWNFIVTLVFAVSLLARQGSLPPAPRVDKAVVGWGIAFAINLWLVNVIFPVDRARAFEFAIYWSKVGIIMPMLLVLALRSRRDLDLFILANTVGLAIWGWEAYTDPKRDASRLVGIGSGDTLDDNAAATHLVLMLPLIVATLLDAKSLVRRAVAAASVVLTINTLVLCNSRGSMVGLAAAVALVPLMARKGHRARAVGAGAAAICGVLLLADPEFIERQQTIASFEEDGSAQGRLTAWREAGRIVADHPLGVGARGFHVLIPGYSAEIAARYEGRERAPHNTVIMVMTEYGAQGIFLWAMTWLSVFRLMWRTRQFAVACGDDHSYYRAVAITVGLAGCLISALFSDRLYSEGIYWVMALALATHRVALSEPAAEPADHGRVPARVA
jgi:hypothetical protein